MYLFFKTVVSAIIIIIVSEVAKKSTWAAAIIVSIPLTSLLAFIWLYIDTKNYEKVIDLSFNTIIMTIPSIVFFILLPILLKLKQNFSLSIIISVLCTAFSYIIFIYLLRRLGMTF
tara:strand:- start:90 stop:437 length:348 start_codon:yes stop_codon:yes gene_type:complete